MAEAAGGREQPAASRAPPDAAHRAEEEPEAASLDAPAGAAGRRRERRSGVSAVGTAERFPGASLGPAAAPDPDACLLEAAKATPRRSSIIKIKEAFKQSVSLSATGYFRGYNEYMDWEKGEGQPFTYFLYGAACSEVEINCLTGDHKNLRTDIVMDIGCSINPAVDIGQIEGAFVQGIGLYTMEELKYSPEGVLCTRGPDQYKIPAVCDIPEQFSVSLLSSSQNPYAIYASKGVGEAGLFLGCSVFFALRDAVTGARNERGLKEPFALNSPLTAEQIRASCTDDFTEMMANNEAASSTPRATSV